MGEKRDVRGDPRPWGETTCGYGPRRPECWEAATTHFLWLPDLATATACDSHAEFIRCHSAIPFEEHAFGGDCGMPGALWHHPYEDEDEGYCVFPAPDDAALLVEEPTPLAVSEHTFGGGYTLSELDALHEWVGLGPEWMASERRAELEAEVTVLGEVIPSDIGGNK